MYKDYAISPELFHWESQNATSPTSPTGKRYLDRARMVRGILIYTGHRRRRDRADGSVHVPRPGGLS